MAQIAGQSEPTLVLAGRVIPRELNDGADGVLVLVEPNTVVDAPEELRDFLTFMHTPRLRSEVLERVASEGGTPDDVAALVESGRLLQLEGESAWQLVNCFSGYRVVATCVAREPWSSHGQVLWVALDETATKMFPTHPFCGSVMWERRDAEDLPATIARLSSQVGVNREEFAGFVLGRSGLGALLALDLARLERAPTKRPALWRRFRSNG